MNAGRFDRKITFQHNSFTRDNVGGKVDAWTDFCDMWANYKPLPSTEGVNGDRVEAKSYVQFICRYRSDLNAAMRIYFEGEYFNITDISEITRRQYLQINATSLTT